MSQAKFIMRSYYAFIYEYAFVKTNKNFLLYYFLHYSILFYEKKKVQIPRS